MKTKLIHMISLALLLIFTLAACEDKNSTESPRQFIEIVSESNTVIGLLTNEASIKNLTVNMDIEKWDYIDQLPERMNINKDLTADQILDEWGLEFLTFNNSDTDNDIIL